MSPAKTRIVHLAAGQQRQEAENSKTCIAVFDQPIVADSFRDLFIRNYDEIRAECTGFAKPGLAISAIDTLTGALVGSLCIAAKVGTANSAIVGRHGMADLYLDGDASLSLRHLVIIVSPLETGSSDVRFRIVDLRTSTAFQDEHGQRFEALVAEGPLFIRCGGYALFCLPTGDPTAWPAAAEDGWACIPERVYLRGERAEPDRWKRRRPHRDGKKKARRLQQAMDDDGDNARGSITLVHSVAGPVRARARLLASGESPLGTLRITADVGIQSLIIGQQAARQGIVLGRYKRCDIDGANVLIHDGISRVHLLVIDIDGCLYAIDTASTHGVWLGQEEREVRIAPMTAGTDFVLGGQLATLRWSPA